ncbi:MAG: sporulation protein YqfC [Syntrophomonadaceae bacterium]|nr:sporulation protein YqfC [Syntrophomonadaceae bacterium]
MKGRDPKDKVQQTLTRLLEMPPDLTLDLPKLTLIGNIQLIVENHRGLIEFGPNRTIINSSRWPIILNGRNLMVRSIRTDELTIEGVIDSITFGD